MIYLKRFCFCIILFLCTLIGVIGTLIEIIAYPIWGVICYVITGNDSLNYFELSLSWKYSMKFLNWYNNKFRLKTKEQYEKRLEELDKQVHEAWEKSLDIEGGWEKAWKWYINQPCIKKHNKLYREYKLIKDYTLRDFDSLDKKCVMPFNEFVKYCKIGPMFTDNDGSGYYATSTQVSDIGINPSDIVAEVYRKDFTHVCWYNK